MSQNKPTAADANVEPITPNMWPLAATRQEMWHGIPHWNGGPYGTADCIRAEAAFPGWTALVGEGNYSLVLVDPPRIDEWIKGGYSRMTPDATATTPPNRNKAAANIIRSAASIASGRGQLGLANQLWAFEERLRDQGRP